MEKTYAWGDEIGRGLFGVVYELSGVDIVVKIAFFAAKPLCKEKVALELLGGLDGFAPGIFKIESGMLNSCRDMVLAIEKMGDASWSDLVEPPSGGSQGTP